VIPVRRRAVLPTGHWWIAHHQHGRLIVTVSALVPPNSELEHELVRGAVRAWQQHKRKGLILAPAPIAGGAGLAWAARKIFRPQVGAGAGAVAAAAGIALAAVVTLTEPPKPAPHRPPVAAAPPAEPATPGHRTTPQRPAKPTPQGPGQSRPRVSGPVTVAAVSTSRVHVDPARMPVRLPAHVPPVHVTPPKLPDPPVTVTPPVKATGCRLVTLELKVVRVCA
jgi:hypothetical protein